MTDNSEGTSSRYARRRVAAVNYVILNGGEDDDEDEEEKNAFQSLKRRRAYPIPSDEGISAKKATVHVSLGSPSAEVVSETKRSLNQGSVPAAALGSRKVLLHVPQGGAKSRIMPLLVKGNSLTGAGSNPKRQILMRLSDGTISSGSQLLQMPLSSSRDPDTAQTGTDNRRFLVRLPNGSLGLLQKPIRPIKVALSPPPPPEEVVKDDPFQAEDEAFMKEVNKFLDSSMSLHSSKLNGGRYLGNEYYEPDDVPLTENVTRIRMSRTADSTAPDHSALVSNSSQVAAVPDYVPEMPPLEPVVCGSGLVSCQMCGAQVSKRGYKFHTKTCKGIVVRWDGGDDDKYERPCPRCGVNFSSSREFEEHMAVEHKCFWRMDFANEEEFKKWFLEEGLDETTIAGPSKVHNNVYEKVYYCAVSGGQRMKVKCPCRVVVKKGTTGIVVRYFPSHNHCDRVVRQQMPNECRDLILSLLKKDMKNANILKVIRERYPESSVNRRISALAISRLRCRYFRRKRDPNKPETRGRKPKLKQQQDAAEVEERESRPSFAVGHETE